MAMVNFVMQKAMILLDLLRWKKLLQSRNKFSLAGEDAKRETPKLMGIPLSMTGNTPTTV